MSHSVNRRHFLGAAAAGVAAGTAIGGGANNRLVVGVMGTGGRGSGLARSFAQLPNVTVAYVCDVDRARVERAAGAVARVAERPPQAVGDFRRILDDRAVDVLVVATCNHWHGPATILGCAAGKHVYCEKPASHNPREGELMIQAARRHRKQVQLGTQRRSFPGIIEAIELVRGGAIGRAYLAKCWYHNLRPSIGRGREASPPEGLDYELWQGPAPRRPFRTNYLHYTWHWFWHWGNGELGNNGVHGLDVCRWGLGVDYPCRVSSAGGRYRYQDDQETPDTHQVAFDFPGRKTITWEGMSHVRMPYREDFDIHFFGETGSLGVRGNGYILYDERGREVQRGTGEGREGAHFRNFLDAVRGNGRLNAEIEEGHKSTLLCHLGNIAHRTGRSLTCDPRDGHIQNDSEAMRLWTREYASGWEPRV
jgi:predicted dehydrogenase